MLITLGWSYEEVLPYFIKSENNTDSHIVKQSPELHGTRGPMQISSQPNADPILIKIMKTLNEFGVPTVDINGRTQLGTCDER